MEGDHKKSMGSTNSIPGVQNRVYIPSSRKIPGIQLSFKTVIPNVVRHSRPVKNGGYRSGTPSGRGQGSLLQSLLNKTIRRIENDYKFETSEQLGPLQKVQDGVDSVYHPSIGERYGDVHTGLKECILPCTHLSKSSEVPAVRGKLGRKDLPFPIPMSPLRPGFRSQGFYKTYGGSGRFPEESGYNGGSLLRRLLNSSRLRSPAQGQLSVSHLNIAESGMDYKLGSNPKTQNKILGSHARFTTLEPRVSVCIPSSSSDPEGTQKDLRGRGQSHIHSSSLAETELVSIAKETVSGRTPPVTRKRGSSSARSSSTPESGSTSAGGLDPERKVLRAKGLSEDVISTLQASRKPVTSAIYTKIWKRFCGFCGETTVDTDHPNIPKILDFLQSGLINSIVEEPASLNMEDSEGQGLEDAPSPASSEPANSSKQNTDTDQAECSNSVSCEEFELVHAW
ncbi:unnamed protein product [Ranitomeya imitator]|uniref:Uncharacterized protein n=1 Tax=Ranitomeya imitator TaxID=111125 RepID=A0ABN9KS22_9NEOB|nr:unnamed protein product [Ranitomeya imitator]